jgi:hypothetical protein
MRNFLRCALNAECDDVPHAFGGVLGALLIIHRLNVSNPDPDRMKQ